MPNKQNKALTIICGLFALLLVFVTAFLYFPPLIQKNYSIKSSLPFAQQQNSHMVNINTASAEELCLLPGIGQEKAKAIIAYRSLNGNFTALKQLENVKGIGPQLINKLNGLVSFSS